MLLMIKLDKPDIETIEIGSNIAIKTGTLQVVFSPSAAAEFTRDVHEIFNRRDKPPLPAPGAREHIRLLRHCDVDYRRALSQIGGTELSIRIRRCFANYGIETLDELCRYPASVLLTMNNFGETSMKLVVDALATIGRKLPHTRKTKLVIHEECPEPVTMPQLNTGTCDNVPCSPPS